MLKLYMSLVSRLEREEGQGMVEYALLAALISVIAIATITTVGLNVDGVFQAIETALPG